MSKIRTTTLMVALIASLTTSMVATSASAGKTHVQRARSKSGRAWKRFRALGLLAPVLLMAACASDDGVNAVGDRATPPIQKAEIADGRFTLASTGTHDYLFENQTGKVCKIEKATLAKITGEAETGAGLEVGGVATGPIASGKVNGSTKGKATLDESSERIQTAYSTITTGVMEALCLAGFNGASHEQQLVAGKAAFQMAIEATQMEHLGAALGEQARTQNLGATNTAIVQALSRKQQ